MPPLVNCGCKNPRDDAIHNLLEIMMGKWRVMCSELQLHKNDIIADPPLFYNEGSGGGR